MNAFTVQVPPGDTLLWALLALGVDVPQDCGGVMACTSCRVIVRDGWARLTAPEEDEIDLLERFPAAESGVRLACQAVSRGGAFTIELLRAVVPRPPAGAMSSTSITLTARAAEHFAAQLARNPDCDAVRISVRPSGCSGVGYAIELAGRRRPDDMLLESAGIAIAVQQASLPHLQGTRIDIVSEGLGTRLDFQNPNALYVCGCGKSFRT